ncbi:acyl-CoA synthetase [Microbacterium ulmi]|uniref:Acyl-CoA synthetase n=1 Tax=Microbacterium ulmi TaxID=179095 RepID=A0A7Y2M089_9MICO|nr:acyl-CoA synthetase [Microbacterium ulmi]NII69316.1 hypothetical protein [Microbacterium ulmi]NNH04070.1 acyl-CoA synthetase [Microbacterium ulmi]
MTQASAVRTFEVRHLQLARAAFAAIAAAMITFSTDHSAGVGLAVFSGFAIATGLVYFVAVWIVYPAGRRWPSVLLGILTLGAGMVGGITALRTNEMFFILVIAWAVATGVVELVSGWRGLRPRHIAPEAERFAAPPMPRSEARDAVTVGILTLALAIGIALVPSGYALSYYIEDAHESFTLTGITIAVGVFGAYAAIVAVYLAIAAFSPQRTVAAQDTRDGDASAGETA